MCSRRLVLTLTLLLSLFMGSAWVLKKYKADMDAANARLQIGSNLARTACGPIEYAIAGEGHPVLVIHGSGGGFDQGLEIAAAMQAAGFRIIAPSRFGYLRTPLPANASPAAQADAHFCLLRELNLDRVTVIGVSAGAPSATQFCLRFPEHCSSLILLVPATAIVESGSTPARPSRFHEFLIRTSLSSDFLFWAGSRLARPAIIESVLATPMQDFRRASSQEQARVLAVLKHIEPVSSRARGLWNDMTVTTAPAEIDFESIRAPTLIVTTRNDGYGTFVGARTAAHRIPGARLITYPDGGHLWVGHHSEVSSEVDEFLRHAR